MSARQEPPLHKDGRSCRAVEGPHETSESETMCGLDSTRGSLNLGSLTL